MGAEGGARDECLGPCARYDRRHESLSGVVGHKRDNRTAKPASGHARGDRAARVGAIDQEVELRNRHLEVIAQALVTLPEELAEATEIHRIGTEGLDHLADPLVLGVDVMHTAQCYWIDRSGEPALELGASFRLA
jgi:hypothetical protein